MVRIPWDAHEVALLFDAYEQVQAGAPLRPTAEALSNRLRLKATLEGKTVEDKFRNVNGMLLYFRSAAYLYTDGKKGLHSPPSILCKVYLLRRDHPEQYAQLLKEARNIVSPEKIRLYQFCEYILAKRPGYSVELIRSLMKKASAFAHKDIFTITEPSQVSAIVQKMNSGSLFKAQFREDAPAIRAMVASYIAFLKDDAASTKAAPEPEPSEPEPPEPENDPDTSFIDFEDIPRLTFTKPFYFTYDGVKTEVSSWQQLFIQLCAKLFTDYKPKFLKIIGGDVPGASTFTYADIRTEYRLRQSREFIKGYYLESNLSSTDIMRRIQDLLKYLGATDRVTVAYRKSGAITAKPPAVPVDKKRVVIAALPARDAAYDYIDFDGSNDLSFRKPAFFCFDGLKHSVDTWATLMGEVCDVLYKHDPDNFLFIMRATPVEFAEEREKNKFIRCRPVGDGWYTDTNLSAATIIRRIGKYLDRLQLCGMLDIALYKEKPKPVEVVPDPPQPADEIIGEDLIDAYKQWLREEKQLAEGTVHVYAWSIRHTVSIIKDQQLKLNLNTAEACRSAMEMLSQSAYYDRYRTSALTQLAEFLDKPIQPVVIQIEETPKADPKWTRLLETYFPEGYEPDDFISQLQVSGNWEELYGEPCPLEGEAIDAAIRACGVFRNGRIFPKNDADAALLEEIRDNVMESLSAVSCAAVASVYDQYRDRLSAISIYTADAMSEALLAVSAGKMRRTRDVFLLQGRAMDIAEDCKAILRAHGGAMSVKEITARLPFIPYDYVSGTLRGDPDCIHVSKGTWILIEHSPISREDVLRIGTLLDERFSTIPFMTRKDTLNLIRERLPYLQEAMDALEDIAVFNIIEYYLSGHYTFSKAVVSQKGTYIDYPVLFRGFAKDHPRFTLADLEAFSDEMGMSINWQSIYNGGAVRINKTEFVHESQIRFDTQAIDAMLSEICTGDYMPLAAVSPAMMMHLPSCGYAWNGYLLLSYLYRFSDAFLLMYNSLGKSGYYGAMVRRNCPTIADYDTLIERALTEDDTWQTDAEALERIVQQGYQAQRRGKNFAPIIERARKNRLKEEA